MDSRIYLQPRLSSTAGYEHPRSLLTSLNHYLPRFEQYSGSIVKQDGEFYEVWSPNSKRRPFCAGMPHVSEKPDYPFHPEDVKLRRIDGHLGPFDVSVSPQLLDRERPWRVLILRDAGDPEIPRAEPEFIDFSAVWISSDSRTGRLPDEIIDRLERRNLELDERMEVLSRTFPTWHPYWQTKPWYPGQRNVSLLKESHSYETVVDVGVAIQRGMKDKDAWIRLIDFSADHGDLTDERQLSEIPESKEEYMGCWINGATASETAWLLLAGVPCFIAHRKTIKEFHDGLPSYNSFNELPEIVRRLDISINPYEVAARRHLVQTLPSPEAVPYVPYSSHPSLHDMQSSSSAQGWSYGDPFPRPAELEDLAPSSEVAPWEPALWRASAEPQFIPNLEYVYVGERRVLWVKPPPVKDVERWKEGGSRKWEKWLEVPVEEVQFNGTQLSRVTRGYCFRPIGESDRDRIKGRAICYDRVQMRMLVLSSSEVPFFPAGVLEPGIFGGPLANTHFFPLATPGVTVTFDGPSAWVYADREPKAENVGASMHEPDTNMLPLLAKLPENLRAFELVEHSKRTLLVKRRSQLLSPDIPPGTLSSMKEAARFRFLEEIVPGRVANIIPDDFPGRRPPSPYRQDDVEEDDSILVPPRIFRVSVGLRIANDSPAPSSSESALVSLRGSTVGVPDSPTEDELSPSPSEDPVEPDSEYSGLEALLRSGVSDLQSRYLCVGGLRAGTSMLTFRNALRQARLRGAEGNPEIIIRVPSPESETYFIQFMSVSHACSYATWIEETSDLGAEVLGIYLREDAFLAASEYGSEVFNNPPPSDGRIASPFTPSSALTTRQSRALIAPRLGGSDRLPSPFSSPATRRTPRTQRATRVNRSGGESSTSALTLANRLTSQPYSRGESSSSDGASGVEGAVGRRSRFSRR